MKNIRKLLLLFAVSLTSISCSSVDSGDTLLWRVDKGDSHVYLLGSIHVGSEDMYPLDKKIMDAYKESEEVAFEVDLSKVNPMELMKLMNYQDGTTLKDKISEENYNKLKKIFEDKGMPESVLLRMKLWAAALTAQQFKMMESGVENTYGIDTYFMKSAEEDSKNVRQLETAEYQMSLFSEFDKVGDSFITYTLESNETNNEVESMIKAWKEGDQGKLNEIINSSRLDYPEFESAFEKIIDERNDNMTKVVEEWLKEKKVIFIVVGAGHLIGERGIINQLSKKEGYKIKNY